MPSTVDQIIAAGTTAVLAGSSIQLLGSGVEPRVETFRFGASVTKTAAGTASNSILVKLGTTGTVSDATIMTFVLPAGTAAIDVGWIEVFLSFRGPFTTQCLAQGHLRMTHNLLSTGLANVPCVDIDAISAAFDATVSGLILSIACTAGALNVLTFKQVFGARIL